MCTHDISCALRYRSYAHACTCVHARKHAVPMHICACVQVPLSSLVGYANALRSLTQGEAALSMQFARYRAIDQHAFDEIQRQVF